MQKNTTPRHNLVQTSVEENIEAVNVWSLDKDFNYTFFNNAHQKAMKTVWDADIKLGSNILPFISDPEYKKGVEETYKALLKGGSHRSTDHFTLNSGDEFYYDNFGNPIYSRDGQINGLMFYTINVTEKMKLQEQLEFSLALLQSIMNSPDDIHILSIDREYNYLFFNNAHNRSMKRFWGASPEIGQNILEMIPASGYKAIAKAFYEKAFREGSAHVTSELDDESGNRVYFKNIAAPVLSPEGEMIGITIFIFDVTVRERAILETQKSLVEKDILLKEIHHRVKNNLQLVSSMINLQLDGITDPKAEAILQDSLNRINTMSSIHQTLYQKDNLARIDIKEHFQRLIDSIVDLFGEAARGVIFEVETDDIKLELDKAIPISLILNELITNALKYAFPDTHSGENKVKVILNCSENEYHLQVRDNGNGVPDDINIDSTMSLGMNLVSIFTEQINGRVEYSTDEGFTVDIYF